MELVEKLGRIAELLVSRMPERLAELLELVQLVQHLQMESSL